MYRVIRVSKENILRPRVHNIIEISRLGGKKISLQSICCAAEEKIDYNATESTTVAIGSCNNFRICLGSWLPLSTTLRNTTTVEVVTGILSSPLLGIQHKPVLCALWVKTVGNEKKKKTYTRLVTTRVSSYVSYDAQNIK